MIQLWISWLNQWTLVSKLLDSLVSNLWHFDHKNRRSQYVYDGKKTVLSIPERRRRHKFSYFQVLLKKKRPIRNVLEL